VDRPAAEEKVFEFIFLCKLCDRLHEQISNGADRCHLECGGPRKRMAFHSYKGPLTETWMATHCFVCGNAADGGTIRCEDPRLPRITNHRRDLGVCRRHTSTLIQELRPGETVITNPTSPAEPPAT